MRSRSSTSKVARAAIVSLTVAVFSLTLVACGGGGDEPDVASGSESPLTFESHEDLVAAAEAEGGTLKAYTSIEPETTEVIFQMFVEKYPFIDLEMTEQSGSDTPRILLEVQGEATDYDVLYLSQEVYGSYLPYLTEVDLLSMVNAGTLDIPAEMINPDAPYTIAVASALAGVSYNKKLLDPSLIPDTWEDFLDPALAGKKFIVDIEPVNLATLIPAWGEEAMAEYAAAIGGQDPIWARGETNAITLMAAGEYQLHFASNYHTASRAAAESPDTIAVKLIEPIPVRLAEAHGIREGSDNVASAILFLEYLAGPEVQAALDELEPLQSSIYAEGSELAKLIEGKETSVWGWEYFPLMPAYLEMILEEWGFPTAQVREEE